MIYYIFFFISLLIDIDIMSLTFFRSRHFLFFILNTRTYVCLYIKHLFSFCRFLFLLALLFLHFAHTYRHRSIDHILLFALYLFTHTQQRSSSSSRGHAAHSHISGPKVPSPKSQVPRYISAGEGYL